ncbi:MAG: malate synthase A [Gammaproteobacteria bacterium]|nr:malate synthase A [Gammaproteobacteria bacterium]MDH5511792.1 malate synthase A [Gammaproteobacteria bacterium]
MHRAVDIPKGITLHAELPDEYAGVLTPEALDFIAGLAHNFESRRQQLLARRLQRQAQLDRGIRPDFLPETRPVRTSDWTIAPVPAEIQDRRVEITGPVDRKMIINAFNSGANVFLADLEDSLTPTWDNVVQGQINLQHAVRRTISFDSPEGRHYALDKSTAVLFVRPRGWHLVEKHLLVDGQPVAASLFDFGLYFFHNARELLDRGTAPYFYLPKLESHIEARLWNEVFIWAQERLNIPRGTIKATVLIETILAAFEMDEILYELRDHSAGLNCGRWDYLFSTIKKFSQDPEFILADRGQVGMTAPFMRAYSLLLIQTCHRRQAHAMGGMAAQIPIRDDPAENETALAKVRADKEREVTDGHDGTWVAHPGLVPLAKEIFDRHMKTPNQISRLREDVHVTAAELLAFGPQTPITEAGLRHNIEVGIEYLGAWLAGTGCVQIHHLMEDAATAEISCSQVWHWIHSKKGVLADGRRVTLEMARNMIPEELQRIRRSLGETAFAAGKYELAAKLFGKFIGTQPLPQFVTLLGYDYLD